MLHNMFLVEAIAKKSPKEGADKVDFGMLKISKSKNLV